MPENRAGVYSMVTACDHAPVDYEEIDTKADRQLFNPPSTSMQHDYTKTPHPLEMSSYEIPTEAMLTVL